MNMMTISLFQIQISGNKKKIASNIPKLDQVHIINNFSQVSKNSEGGTQVMKNEDLSKVLLDVKQLRGRQATLDSQLAAMKQENAVLWRELAVLRQKHTKQQQIVNKVCLVQKFITI